MAKLVNSIHTEEKLKKSSCRGSRNLYQLIATVYLVLFFVPAYADVSSRINNVMHHSSDEFVRYELVKPSLYHSRSKRAIIDTRLENGFHVKEVTLSYRYRAEEVIIDLELNQNLIPRGHFMRYQSPDGTDVVQHFNKADIDLCHYKGTIKNRAASYVALSTCLGINGVIFDGEELYYIDAKLNGNMSDEHYLSRHSDRVHKPMTCGVGNKHENDPSINKDSVIGRKFKRSADTTSLQGPYNAMQHSFFVELVLVVDNSIYKNLDRNFNKVHNYCKDIVNFVTALFMPLNIFVSLVGVVVWNERDMIELSSVSEKTLLSFLKYRRDVLAIEHPNDNAQLLTGQQFEGGVVGKAVVGSMCTDENSGGVSANHSAITNLVASTVAHEMGHNFGMHHDTANCKCEKDPCIMQGESNDNTLDWSSCSKEQLNVAANSGWFDCLRNKPVKLFDDAICGNGFVEPGEQCDCGLPDFCQNSCCNPNTCMLHSNASCATGECCDLTTCHPRTAGTVCRTADGECDLPEYCTGESEYCPQNYFKRDTELCDDGKAYCYEGACQSHSDQCKLLWGPSGHSMDECYANNLNGSEFGHCGKDARPDTFIRCSEEDIMCGKLQCKSLTVDSQFEEKSNVRILLRYSRNYPYVLCQSVSIDAGTHVDPGLSPNGAICGDGKMCIRQKCLSIENLRAQGIGVDCAENCNRHGICNNEGHCHCDAGFAPPLCKSPGHGGSVFSGPAANPNEGSGFALMYVFFLGVVLFLLLTSLLLYYRKQIKKFFISRTQLKSNESASMPYNSIHFVQ